MLDESTQSWIKIAVEHAVYRAALGQPIEAALEQHITPVFAELFVKYAIEAIMRKEIRWAHTGGPRVRFNPGVKPVIRALSRKQRQHRHRRTVRRST